jgi:DNA-binding transcriptional ArsR family regulator
MAVIRVTPDDLTKMRFAYRPLIEIPLSYRVWINPEFHWPHLRWVENTSRALYDVELPYLDALVPAHGFIPDFLTPTPIANRTNIEDDLEDVLATPDDLIRKNIHELIAYSGDSEMRRFYLAHPREAVHCLVEDLRLYWQRTLERSWSRMVAILEGDILYRGRLLALDGPDTLIPDLHPSITFQQGEIHMNPVCCTRTPSHYEASLNGEGIQLVPTVFTGCGRVYQVTPEWRPMIGYSARGVGLYNRETRASKPLELALGAGRARVLQGLRVPSTTGEVAHRLGLTSGAISQQLERLKRAGLVEPHRNGKRVYYRLTPRGEELIALFERSL